MNHHRRHRPPNPPPASAAYARTYRCSDCRSVTDPPRLRHGVWILTVRHDDSCPVLAGHVDHTRAGLAAAAATAHAAGGPVAYLSPGPTAPAT